MVGQLSLKKGEKYSTLATTFLGVITGVGGDFQLTCEKENFAMLQDILNQIPQQKLKTENWKIEYPHFRDWVVEQAFLSDILMGQYDPFHIAVNSGCINIVEQYLKEGKNINDLSGYGGKAPLHIAVDNQDIAMVKMLLNYHPDINIQTINDLEQIAGVFKSIDWKWVLEAGLTPLDFAIKNQNQELEDLLKAYGAHCNKNCNSMNATSIP